MLSLSATTTRLGASAVRSVSRQRSRPRCAALPNEDALLDLGAKPWPADELFTDAGIESDTEYEAHLTAEIPSPVSMATDENAPRAAKGTHIVCTLGPSSRSVSECEALLQAGMSVARFNFSHGTHEYHSETLRNLREACASTGRFCAVLQDTKGPEIRTGFLKGGGPVTYELGSEITVTSDYEVKGDAQTMAVSYANVASVVQVGGRVLCADGSLVLEVVSAAPSKGTLVCRCLNTATIGERKNCNLPGAIVGLPVLTRKDKSDLRDWGLKEGVDYVAASFVRKASDVHEVRAALQRDDDHQNDEAGAVLIISKIENQEGLDNIDEIIEASDGIMVARGDLGMEVPLEKMFAVQKMIIHKCNLAGKPVVTATQMLESMINNPRPTRAEATDVANAVLDGTDSVMLSGETAAGSFPVEACAIMASIASEAEKYVDNTAFARLAIDRELEMSVSGTMTDMESLASSAVTTAAKVGADAIVVLAASGMAARLIAKYRPSVPVIVGVVPRGRAREAIGFHSHIAGGTVARQCLLHRSLNPVILSPATEGMPPAAAAKVAIEAAIDWAKQADVLSNGDKVVTMYNVEETCTVLRCQTVE